MNLTCGFSHHMKPHAFTREPGLPFWTMGMIVEGRSRLSAPHTHTIMTSAPYVFLTPPSTPYTVSQDEDDLPFVGFAAIFEPTSSIMHLLSLPPILDPIMGLAIPAEYTSIITTVIHDLHDITRSHYRLRAQLTENALQKLLLLINSIVTEEGKSIDTPIQEAMTFLENNLTEPLILEQLAEKLNMSLSSLSHRFREQVGISPVRFREECRMRQAQFLLMTTNMPIYTIAMHVGYGNAYHFSTRFKKYVGKSPSAYRNAPAPS